MFFSYTIKSIITNDKIYSFLSMFFQNVVCKYSSSKVIFIFRIELDKGHFITISFLQIVDYKDVF